MIDIYEQLNVKKVIDAWGTVTKLGGSKMSPEVLKTMEDASHSFVDMNELHTAAGKRIADLLGVEAACVTCGAAAGLAIGTAACMTGMNRAHVYQLPDTTNMKNEIIALKCHRDLYDQSILLTGAHFKEVGVTSFAFPEQIEEAIDEHTAAFFFTSEAETMRGSIPFEDIVKVCRKHDIPIIVDAAAEIPPVYNIRKYLDLGASLVVFSGGKELRGPQASGLILGKKDLIEACDLNCCPNYGIGRCMKIDKENICGLVKAVELFVAKDYDTELNRWAKQVEHIQSLLKECSQIQTRTGFPDEPGVQPVCILRLFVKPLTMTSEELHQKLIDGTPCVYTFIHQDEIVINPQCLDEGELELVANTIKKAIR